MVVFIKQNSPETREKLKNAGYSICVCASFFNSIWLDYHPDSSDCSDFFDEIHGIGYTDECEGLWDLTPEERIKAWLSQDGYFDKEREFFDTVDEFLAKYPKKKYKEE